MEDLKNLVVGLKNEQDEGEQIKILQQINEFLLTRYVIQIGNLEIEPLLVEAYYYDGGVSGFKDENCHKQPKQKGEENFGKLYFHKKGYGGVDLCLSHGDYYLSFLLKCSRIKNHDTICRQTTLYDVLKQECEAQLVPKAHGSKSQIVHLPRKGLTKETYKTESLASLLVNEVIHKPVAVSLAKGKQWTLAKYAIEHQKKEIESATDFLKREKLYDAKLEERYFNDALDYISKNSFAGLGETCSDSKTALSCV